jgi:uncharacterized protein DUF5666
MYAPGLRSSLLIACAALLLAVGCGQGNQLYSPTGPTAGASAVADEDGLAFSANAASESELSALDKGGHGHDSEKEHGEHGRSHEGRVVGFVGAKSTDTLTVRGMTIKIQNTTLIRHGHRHLTIADIEVGDHVQARGTLSDDKKTLTATEVKVENTDNDKDDDDDEDEEDENEVEVKGTVSELSSGCPSGITFKVGTTTVRTNDKTRFDDVTCSALANGNIVEVEGVRRNDGSVLATEVELESGPNEVEGTISGLTGTPSSCPSRTFTIGSTTVMTNNSTSYDEVSCATLANGMKVEVEGTLSGSTLTAARIEKQ